MKSSLTQHCPEAKEKPLVFEVSHSDSWAEEKDALGRLENQSH